MCTEYKSLKIHRTKFKKCTPCFIHGLTVPFIHTFIDVKRRNNQSSTITARCLPVRSEQLRIVCSLHFFVLKNHAVKPIPYAALHMHFSVIFAMSGVAVWCAILFASLEHTRIDSVLITSDK